MSTTSEVDSKAGKETNRQRAALRRTILGRFARSISVSFWVMVICFLLLRLSPGDPVRIAAGADATEAQIAEMRSVLKNYAKKGRTVIISSHLLSEVEQTCTDVVLMHRGKLITSGPMKKILKSGKKSKSLEEFFLELIGDDLVIGKAVK